MFSYCNCFKTKKKTLLKKKREKGKKKRFTTQSALARLKIAFNKHKSDAALILISVNDISSSKGRLLDAFCIGISVG